MEPSMDTLAQLAMHTAGAVLVTGGFLWYLYRRDNAMLAEQEAERRQMQHIMDQHSAAMDRMVAYLQSRDAQSKEIASTGHAALQAVATQLQNLREQLLEDRRKSG